MARTTISVPDDLKAEMDALGDSTINWSATAAEAFRVEIGRHEVRRQQKEGKKMQAAKARLKASRDAYLAEAAARGTAAGTQWAQEEAEYLQLKRLADTWAAIETTESNDAHGAPGMFLGFISDGELGDRQDINGFWTDLGEMQGEMQDEDKYSVEFWDAFAVAALEVYKELDE